MPYKHCRHRLAWIATRTHNNRALLTRTLDKTPTWSFIESLLYKYIPSEACRRLPRLSSGHCASLARLVFLLYSTVRQRIVRSKQRNKAKPLRLLSYWKATDLQISWPLAPNRFILYAMIRIRLHNRSKVISVYHVGGNY